MSRKQPSESISTARGMNRVLRTDRKEVSIAWDYQRNLPRGSGGGGMEVKLLKRKGIGNREETGFFLLQTISTSLSKNTTCDHM